jgi:diketogulonate reductase-like aldo/keto reductase
MHIQDDERAAAAAVINIKPIAEPQTVLLPGGKGDRMPLLALGSPTTTASDDDMLQPSLVEQALALGICHFDCATVTKNQAIIGQALKPFLSKDKANRSKLFVSIKLWNNEWSDPEMAITKSITELGLDGSHDDGGGEKGYIDLVMVHFPPSAPQLQATWRVLEGLVEKGLVKYLGVCNFGLKMIEDMLTWVTVKPIVNQVELHPLLPQRKMIGVLLRKGVYSSAFLPLGGNNDELVNHPAVIDLSKETGQSPAQVLVKWSVQRGVPVVVDWRNFQQQLNDVNDGLWSWKLTWDQKSKLDALAEKEGVKRYYQPSWHVYADEEEGGAVKPSTLQ